MRLGCSEVLAAEAKRVREIEESDTDHAQFRQHYNTWGRWMSPDPYSGSYDPTNPQSFNRYSYVTNNPLAHVDPSGLDDDPDCGDDCDTTDGGGGGGGGGGTGGDRQCTFNSDGNCQVTGNRQTGPDRTEIFPVGSVPAPTIGNLGVGPGKPPAPQNSTPQQPDGRTLPSCRSFGFQTAADDLNPFTPSAFDLAQGAATAGSMVTFNQALSNAATKGLTYPNKSSVFSGLMSESGVLIAVADAMPLVAAEFAAIDAVHTELTAQ
jgi:RHS repeat-associated protein